MRRAQRRQIYGVEATNLAWERVDSGSDYKFAPKFGRLDKNIYLCSVKGETK
jgi:hypothetical protein